MDKEEVVWLQREELMKFQDLFISSTREGPVSTITGKQVPSDEFVSLEAIDLS